MSDRRAEPVGFEREARAHATVTRPATCPSCASKAVGTLAKDVTVDTAWRCQACGETWKVAGRIARG